jgi:hypothetical protein
LLALLLLHARADVQVLEECNLMGNHLDLPTTATYGEQHTQITGQRGRQFAYKATLGGSGFLRTFLYKHSEYGSVVVKVMFLRTDASS